MTQFLNPLVRLAFRTLPSGASNTRYQSRLRCSRWTCQKNRWKEQHRKIIPCEKEKSVEVEGVQIALTSTRCTYCALDACESPGQSTTVRCKVRVRIASHRSVGAQIFQSFLSSTSMIHGMPSWSFAELEDTLPRLDMIVVRPNSKAQTFCFFPFRLLLSVASLCIPEVKQGDWRSALATVTRSTISVASLHGGSTNSKVGRDSNFTGKFTYLISVVKHLKQTSKV